MFSLMGDIECTICISSERKTPWFPLQSNNVLDTADSALLRSSHQALRTVRARGNIASPGVRFPFYNGRMCGTAFQTESWRKGEADKEDGWMRGKTCVEKEAVGCGSHLCISSILIKNAHHQSL